MFYDPQVGTFVHRGYQNKFVRMLRWRNGQKKNLAPVTILRAELETQRASWPATRCMRRRQCTRRAPLQKKSDKNILVGHTTFTKFTNRYVLTLLYLKSWIKLTLEEKIPFFQRHLWWADLGLPRYIFPVNANPARQNGQGIHKFVNFFLLFEKAGRRKIDHSQVFEQICQNAATVPALIFI